MIQGKLAELYVDLTARDKIAPAIAEVQGRIANLKADLAKAGTAGWGQQVQTFIQSQKQSAEEQKKLSRAFDVAAMGSFGASMKAFSENLGAIQEKLGGVSGVFPMAMASMTGFVAAASPDTFTTFTMSLQYLAASIGQALLPSMIEIVRWVQTAARWFQNLDSDTKGLIGTAALWVVGLSGAAFALNRIIGISRTLITVFNALAAHPWVLVLMAAAAIVGPALMGDFGRGPSAPGGGPLFRPEATRTVVGRVAASAGSVAADETGSVFIGGSAAAGLIRADTTPSAMPWTPRLAESARSSSPFSRGLASMGMLPGSGISDGGRDAPGFLHATNFQSQFMGIEQQWKHIQQAGASNSPLEEEMRRIAMESRDYLHSVATSTATTAGLPPPSPPTSA
jgi:hypothetical protein